MEAAELLHCIASFTVRQIEKVWIPRVEVSDISTALVADGADHIEAFVDTLAGAEDVFSLRGQIRAEEGTAVHVGGDIEAGEVEDGWAEVDEVD